MELKINPEDVNKLVADAVLNSAIGEAIKKSIVKEMGNLNRTFDNPIDTVIRNHVSEITRNILIAEYGETIREKMKVILSEKLSDEFISRVCDKAADRYT